jgi:DNA-binding NtrC family response regulator
MQTTVLIVTDETRLRPALKAALERRGYSVLAVRSSLQAFVAAAKNPIHALITKVELEGVQGPALGRIMSQRFPGVAVMYLSAPETKTEEEEQQAAVVASSHDPEAIADQLGGVLEELRKKPASKTGRKSTRRANPPSQQSA